MATYVAHYRSPDASSQRARGAFEFESDARVGSKENGHDARMRMLELFGKDAVSWQIEKVELKRRSGEQSDNVQLELDFREPKPERKRKPRREYW